MTDVFAVGAIDGRETELARLGCYQSRTEIVLSGKAPLNDFDRYPADDGNAVPALLPVRVYLIAKGVERLVRKLIVRYFQFLQTDNVGLTRLQPNEDEIQTGSQPVDIPGCYAHADAPLNVVKHSVRGRRSHSHGRPG